MTVLKNVFAFLVFAACATYVTLAVTVLPATRSALISITSGQAFAVAVGYLLIMINQHGPTVARITSKLRRLTRRQVKLFFAQMALWSVGVGALVYSILTQL